MMTISIMLILSLQIYIMSIKEETFLELGSMVRKQKEMFLVHSRQRKF